MDVAPAASRWLRVGLGLAVGLYVFLAGGMTTIYAGSTSHSILGTVILLIGAAAIIYGMYHLLVAISPNRRAA